MPAELERFEEQSLNVLRVRGRLGLDDLEPFERHLDELHRARTSAIVDLLGCPFLASRVFPALLRTSQSMEAAGRRLHIACPDDLFRILEVLRLNEHLTVHPTFEDCLRAARKH